MAKRLNDTAGIVAIPLYDDWTGAGKPGERDTFPANPNGGRAVTARGRLKSPMTYGSSNSTPDNHDTVGRANPRAGVGVECLRGATMYMGEKLGTTKVRGRK